MIHFLYGVIGLTYARSTDRRSNRSSSEGRSPGGGVAKALIWAAQRAKRSFSPFREGKTIGPMGRRYETVGPPSPGPTRCAGAPPWLKELTGFQPAGSVSVSVPS